jgi:hypothetical protein
MLAGDAGGSALALLWRRHRVLTLALVLATALTLFLGIRLIAFTIYWSQHRDAPLQDWMTLGYVAHSYHVDRDGLAAAVGVEPAQRDRRLTLAEIARLTGRDPAEVHAAVEAAIARSRAPAKP